MTVFMTVYIAVYIAVFIIFVDASYQSADELVTACVVVATTAKVTSSPNSPRRFFLLL